MTFLVKWIRVNNRATRSHVSSENYIDCNAAFKMKRQHFAISQYSKLCPLKRRLGTTGLDYIDAKY